MNVITWATLGMSRRPLYNAGSFTDNRVSLAEQFCYRTPYPSPPRPAPPPPPPPPQVHPGRGCEWPGRSMDSVYTLHVCIVFPFSAHETETYPRDTLLHNVHGGEKRIHSCNAFYSHEAKQMCRSFSAKLPFMSDKYIDGHTKSTKTEFEIIFCGIVGLGELLTRF